MHSRQFYCIADNFIAQQKALLQKALLHSKQLQCTAESYTVQQEALLHNRKFCCIAEKSVLRQKLEKSSFCGRNQRKVPFAAEMGEKFLLRQKQRTSTTFCPPQACSWQTRHSLRTSRTKLSCSWTGLNFLTQNTRAQYRRRQPSPL